MLQGFTSSTISDHTLRYILSCVVATTMLAIFGLNYFHEGSDASKYASRQSEIERVNDTDIENYTDMILFGDPLEAVDQDLDLSEKAGEDVGFQTTENIFQIDKLLLTVFTVATLLMVIPFFQNNRYLIHLYLLIGIYILIQAYYQGLNGGKKFADLTTLAHATRWLLAVGLWFWFWKPTADQHFSRILQFACALTFATHGAEAYLLNPSFKDLLYGAFELFQLSLSERYCHYLLKVIGIMDICLAICVLFYKNPKILLWMAFWGALTALSRPLTLGNEHWLEAQLRIANCFVPLALYLYFHKRAISAHPVKNYDSQTT